jgi:hypothetical protein
MSRASSLPTSHASSRLRIGRSTTGVAVVGLVAVVGSLLTAPSAAHATEVPVAAAQAAVSASLGRGTYVEDVLDGRITVDQLVEVDVAARSTTTAGAPSRAELTRQATDEIERFRAAGSAPSLSAGDGADAVGAPVDKSKHWWNKLVHWGTIRMDAYVLAAAGATAGTAIAAVMGVCGSYGAIVCAAVAAMAAGTALGLSVTAAGCLSDHHRSIYIKVPDFWKTHCGD